ncbi:MAG: Rpn family recombination-promoting nuclease/putative transposase, partial [candidate division NC10 bacterium]
MDTTSEPDNDSGTERDRLPRSVLRDFPDRAIRWLLESPDNVRGLLLAAVPALVERFDLPRLRQAPRSFVQESLRAREADCVLRVPFRAADGTSEREVWVYILIEHQSAPDAWLAFRLLSYMLALWESERREQEERGVPMADRRLSAILPLVLYTGQRPWERLTSLRDLVDVPAELEAFVPRHDSVFFSVSMADPRTLTAGGDPLGYVLLLFHLAEAPVEELAEALREVFTGLEGLARAGELDRYYRLAWIVVGFIRYRRPPEEVDRLL